MKQQALYKISGMVKDIADSAMDKQQAFHIHNMRLSHDDKNIFSALVNEPGTLKARDENGNIVHIKGTVIGFNTINDTGILFTHEDPSFTYSEVTAEHDSNSTHSYEQGASAAPRRAPEFDDRPSIDERYCTYQLTVGSNPMVTAHEDASVSFQHTGGGVVNVLITITNFSYPSAYSGTTKVFASGGAVSLYNPNDDTAYSSFEVVQGSQFTAKLTIPAAMVSVPQTIYASVLIIPQGFVEETSNHPAYRLQPVTISFTVSVPAANAGGTTSGGDLSVFDDPVTRVVADLPLEQSAKTWDHIYLVKASKRSRVEGAGDDTAITVTEFFRGDLGFSTKYPIESTVYFENDEVQKVYWVDGINPLRYANIAKLNDGGYWTNNLMFDSVPRLHLQEEVKVVRNSTGGVFPSCAIQFAFTYLNRYGAESNIAWISPIYYSSLDDRGGAPDEVCSNSFTVNIRRFESDGRFNYIRLYHIIRTTLDTEVEVRRVADIAIPKHWGETIVYTDTNTTGEAVDPTELLYLGGSSIIPGTLEQKSNTLFLGNLAQEYSYLRDVVFEKTETVDNTEVTTSLLSWGSNDVPAGGLFFNPDTSDVPADKFSGYYSHENQLRYGAHQITSFRRGEDYRLGFQAQDSTGHWSDVWWLGDYVNTGAYPLYNAGVLKPVHAHFTLASDVVDILRNAGYRKVRPVAVFPESWERNIYTEGLLNPTVYNVKDRASNAPYAQSSWFLRPFPPTDISGISQFTDADGNFSWVYSDSAYKMPVVETFDFLDRFEYTRSGGGTWEQDFQYISIDSFIKSSGALKDYSNYGSCAEYRHNHSLGDSQQRNGEVQSMYNERPQAQVSGDSLLSAKYSLKFPWSYAADTDADRRSFINRYADFFYVDQSLLTMNSADIEFDQNLHGSLLGESKLRIVGLCPINSFVSSYSILTNTPPNKFFNKDNNSLLIPQGFYGSEIVGASMDKASGFGWRSFISAPIWHDDLSYLSAKGSSYENVETAPVGFAVYPWQASGSLNNDSAGTRRTYPTDDNNEEDNKKESNSLTGDNYISGELKYKTIANLHYSHRLHHITDLSNAKAFPVSSAAVFDIQSVSLTKLKDGASGDLHYFGAVDKLITPITDAFTVSTSGSESSANEVPLSRFGGFPRMASALPYYAHSWSYPSLAHLAFLSPYSPLKQRNTLTAEFGNGVTKTYDIKLGSDRSMSTIPIRYNSCNHLVLSMDKDNGYRPYFGWIGSGGEPSAYSKVPFWSPDSEAGTVEVGVTNSFSYYTVSDYQQTFDGVDVYDSTYDYIRFDGNPAGYLYMGQLFRETPVPNKFGGSSEEALEQNMWLPSGEAVYLEPGESVVLEWSVGDTYYQRYDALRTYPQTEEDMNKVIDIVSFMTETHVNIDGRYDRNRGLTDNNHIRSKNFNKLNYVYSQRDNFFVYHTLNKSKVHLDTFKYSFTWTMSKIAGSLRDEWTRITLANSYDCDGNKGELTRISRLDNLLVAFQSGGVAQIMFNENVQLQGSEGTPIELANSGKMQGLRYYTTEIGCQNKWSVNVAPNGIYFIDGRSKSLYVVGSEGIQDVSKASGMSSWFLGRTNLLEPWNPYDWQGIVSHWDMTTGELFITSKDYCLCFDTSLGVFSSFYDYQKTGALFALGGTVLSFHEDDSATKQSESQHFDCLWLHRKNQSNYCYIFNKQRSSSVEVICNSNGEGSDYGLTKIFDNITWRADAWEVGFENNDKVFSYKPFVTFDGMKGFDDYQDFRKDFDVTTGEVQTSAPIMPINLRKKFKQWHTTMPRAGSWNSTGTEWVEGTDRICDTWCHISMILSEEVSRYRHVLHDLVISYFIP